MADENSLMLSITGGMGSSVLVVVDHVDHAGRRGEVVSAALVSLSRSFLAASLAAAVLGFSASSSLAAPLGEITEFSSGLNGGAQPNAISVGPDGNLWFTDTGSTTAIGRATR